MRHARRPTRRSRADRPRRRDPCIGIWRTPVSLDRSTVSAAIASELDLAPADVSGVIALLTEGSTIPFIARYRKEKTGGLDEVQIGAIDDALSRARALVDHKTRVLRAIFEQGALSPDLERAVLSAHDARELDDLYLPYKRKRKTRAGVARERGLEPLAGVLLTSTPRHANRASILEPFVDPARGVDDRAAALQGACDIVAERWSEDRATRAWLRHQLGQGRVRARKKRGYDGDDHRFEGLYDHREPISRLAAHRVLAMRRGEAENVLSVTIEVDDDRLTDRLTRRLLGETRTVFRQELEVTVRDCYGRLLKPSLSTEVLSLLRETAEQDAIGVFARNLEELLLAPPAHNTTILGIDPGFRTGCKVVVIDPTGKLVAHATVYPTEPRHDVVGAEQELLRLVDTHRVGLIAIGNGTASRETAAFCARLEQARPTLTKVIVNESGASIYSASAVAREEFPDLDVTIRGAVSIARRLQDPLAELVKIEPKSIGVGQYQHDVNQSELKKTLDRVVSSAVNRVGVDVNRASASLLSHVSGIGPKLARAIVAYREDAGRFGTRADLLKVPRFGARAFEQSAGFLRVRDGQEPLDASAVHPESYHLVEQIATHLACQPGDLLGDEAKLKTVDPGLFVGGSVGLPTVRDTLDELSKPGRDPRQQYEPLRFEAGIETIDDLETGMRLEGVVTNVTHFGAFVDIGVHQDGLVHVSELDGRYVRDPGEVVKVGDRVRVQVLEIDLRRRRIGLSRKRAQPSVGSSGSD